MSKLKMQQRINSGDIPTMYELLETYTERELAEKLHKYLLMFDTQKQQRRKDLPSDDEIEKEANKQFSSAMLVLSFMEGCGWIKKYLNQKQVNG